jgi:hypothetical protein
MKDPYAPTWGGVLAWVVIERLLEDPEILGDIIGREIIGRSLIVYPLLQGSAVILA